MNSTLGAAPAAGTVDQSLVDSMVGAFNNLSVTALAGLAAIAGIAIVLFSGRYAWAYAKKIFGTIAR